MTFFGVGSEGSIMEENGMEFIIWHVVLVRGCSEPRIGMTVIYYIENETPGLNEGTRKQGSIWTPEGLSKEEEEDEEFSPVKREDQGKSMTPNSSVGSDCPGILGSVLCLSWSLGQHDTLGNWSSGFW